MKEKSMVLILVPFQKRFAEKIKNAFPQYTVIWEPDAAEERQIELCREAEICIGEPSIAAIRQSETLRLVQMTWAGTDKYTRGESKFPKGVSLCNASGAFGHLISQYVLGAILGIYQNFGLYQKHMEDNIWKEGPAAETIEGKKVLIFGTGDVGRWVARRLKAMGAGSITGVRRSHIIPAEFQNVCQLFTAQEYLRDADIVVNCMPAADDNQNYLNHERLLMMRKDAVLINVGRGSFVDNTALARVLDAGHLRGAVLDVTEQEPLLQDHPLWKCERLFLTPHIAGPSLGNVETEALITEICLENIARYQRKERLKNLIIDGEL